MIFGRQAVSLTVIGALSLTDITTVNGALATATNKLQHNNADYVAVGNRANSNAKNGGLRGNGHKNNNRHHNRNRKLGKRTKGSTSSSSIDEARTNRAPSGGKGGKGGKKSKSEASVRAGPIERDPIILGVDETAEEAGAVIPTPKPEEPEKDVVANDQVAATNTNPTTDAPTSSSPTVSSTDAPTSSSPTVSSTDAPTSSSPTVSSTETPTSSSPTVSSTKTPTGTDHYTDEPTADAPTLSPAADISSSISDFIGGDDEATNDDTASPITTTPTVSPTDPEVETKIGTEDDESMELPLEIVKDNELDTDEEEENDADGDDNAAATGSENFYQDYVPEDNISVTSTPTTSPTTASPTHKPTNANSAPPSSKPTNAPIVPPPTASPTEEIAVPENACFEENGVNVCVEYFDDYSCDMHVDGVACECCFFDPQYKFISTFDCTNIGDEWGAMGLCTPGTFPSEDTEAGGRDGVGEDTLSLDFGSNGDDVDADNMSVVSRERRGRRTRAQVLRRKAKTKRRRESVVE